ncbi:MAG: hypothetical protein K8G79_07460 [bacterium]|uniref:PEGA domain-containing protein n=1 Tax=Candidatus Methylomirabilis tolerans TaxID=3123416 RepID=A0AAJ1AJX0_9BACT|nr:hypothetical protein [Candidatus Methylomirabilis sp.]
MNIVNGIRRWSVLILVSALAVTVPLAEARSGSHGGGSRGGDSHGSGGRDGGSHGGNHGSRHGHGGFHSGVVVEFGGWWNPWWHGGYGPYGWGAPGYYGYGYSGYPYGGYAPSYAYPPAVPPAAYDYGVETLQAPAEPPPVYQGPPPVTSQAPPAPSFWMPTDPRAAAASASLQIEVTPEETEILVDGARVGMAKEFQGPVIVLVAAGSHALGFRVGGLTIIEDIVASPRTTVLIKRDMGTTVVPKQ